MLVEVAKLIVFWVKGLNYMGITDVLLNQVSSRHFEVPFEDVIYGSKWMLTTSI